MYIPRVKKKWQQPQPDKLGMSKGILQFVLLFLLLLLLLFRFHSFFSFSPTPLRIRKPVEEIDFVLCIRREVVPEWRYALMKYFRSTFVWARVRNVLEAKSSRGVKRSSPSLFVHKQIVPFNSIFEESQMPSITSWVVWSFWNVSLRLPSAYRHFGSLRVLQMEVFIK